MLVGDCVEAEKDCRGPGTDVQRLTCRLIVAYLCMCAHVRVCTCAYVCVLYVHVHVFASVHVLVVFMSTYNSLREINNYS